MKLTRSIVCVSTTGITESKQLSNLDSALNGVDQDASKIRKKSQELMRAVRSGTYEVDAVQVSRRIIGHTLGAA
jgi:anti-sigma28 factor (negative regulator of flagellin synthesis)